MLIRLITRLLRAIQAKAFFKSELISTSVTTYIIGLSTLARSVILVNFFGLEVRGLFISTVLSCTIWTGILASIYEGVVPYLSPRHRRASLVFLSALAAGVMAVIEISTGSDKSLVVLIAFNAVLIVYAAAQITATISTSITRYNLLRFANYGGSLAIHVMIVIFLAMSNQSTIESENGAELLVAAWTISNITIATVAFVLSLKKYKVTNVPGSSRHIVSSGILFSIRSYLANLDKILVEKFLSTEALGAYATIMSIMSLGGPIINALLQLSHHTERHIVTMSGVSKTIGASLLVSLLLLPIIDTFLFASKLRDFWYLALLAAIILFFLAVMRAGENISLKKNRGHVFLAGWKTLVMITSLLCLTFLETGPTLLVLVSVVFVFYTFISVIIAGGYYKI